MAQDLRVNKTRWDTREAFVAAANARAAQDKVILKSFVNTKSAWQGDTWTPGRVHLGCPITDGGLRSVTMSACTYGIKAMEKTAGNWILYYFDHEHDHSANAAQQIKSKKVNALENTWSQSSLPHAKKQAATKPALPWGTTTNLSKISISKSAANSPVMATDSGQFPAAEKQRPQSATTAIDFQKQQTANTTADPRLKRHLPSTKPPKPAAPQPSTSTSSEQQNGDKPAAPKPDAAQASTSLRVGGLKESDIFDSIEAFESAAMEEGRMDNVSLQCYFRRTGAQGSSSLCCSNMGIKSREERCTYVFRAWKRTTNWQVTHAHYSHSEECGLPTVSVCPEPDPSLKGSKRLQPSGGDSSGSDDERPLLKKPKHPSLRRVQDSPADERRSTNINLTSPLSESAYTQNFVDGMPDVPRETLTLVMHQSEFHGRNDANVLLDPKLTYRSANEFLQVARERLHPVSENNWDLVVAQRQDKHVATANGYKKPFIILRCSHHPKCLFRAVARLGANTDEWILGASNFNHDQHDLSVEENENTPLMKRTPSGSRIQQSPTNRLSVDGLKELQAKSATLVLPPQYYPQQESIASDEMPDEDIQAATSPATLLASPTVSTSNPFAATSPEEEVEEELREPVVEAAEEHAELGRFLDSVNAGLGASAARSLWDSGVTTAEQIKSFGKKDWIEFVNFLQSAGELKVSTFHLFMLQHRLGRWIESGSFA